MGFGKLELLQGVLSGVITEQGRNSLVALMRHKCECSVVGNASASQAGDRGFKSRHSLVLTNTDEPHIVVLTFGYCLKTT